MVVAKKAGAKSAARMSATKPAAKKAAAVIKVTAASKKPRYGAKFTGKPASGYEKFGDIYLPISEKPKAIVPASKLSAGLEASQAQIKKSLQGLASVFTEDFVVSEIELSVSFSAEGKFLGFGAGGAMSVKIKIRPTDDV